MLQAAALASLVFWDTGCSSGTKRSARASAGVGTDASSRLPVVAEAGPVGQESRSVGPSRKMVHMTGDWRDGKRVEFRVMCGDPEAIADLLWSSEMLSEYLGLRGITGLVDDDSNECGYRFVDGEREKIVSGAQTDVELREELDSFFPVRSDDFGAGAMPSYEHLHGTSRTKRP